MKKRNILILIYVILPLAIIIALFAQAYKDNNYTPMLTKKATPLNKDSLYSKTSKENIKDTKIFLGFKLMQSKIDFDSKLNYLISHKIVVKKYFPLLDASSWGYDFKFRRDVSVFGAIYSHFYKNKLYNLEIELFNNTDKEIDVHDYAVSLYKGKYSKWKYVEENGSSYWFNDGKMIIIHENVINYISPKYEILSKKYSKHKADEETVKTKDII